MWTFFNPLPHWGLRSSRAVPTQVFSASSVPSGGRASRAFRAFKASGGGHKPLRHSVTPSPKLSIYPSTSRVLAACRNGKKKATREKKQSCFFCHGHDSCLCPSCFFLTGTNTDLQHRFSFQTPLRTNATGQLMPVQSLRRPMPLSLPLGLG